MLFVTDEYHIPFLDAQLQPRDVLDGMEGRSHWLILVDATRKAHFVNVFRCELYLHVVPVGDDFHQLIQRATIEEEVASVPRGVEVDVHLIYIRRSAGCKSAFSPGFRRYSLPCLLLTPTLPFTRTTLVMPSSLLVQTLNSVP